MSSSIPLLSILFLIIEGRNALLSPSLRRPALSPAHRDGPSGRTLHSSLSASPSSSADERSRRRARIRSGSGGAAVLSKTRRRSKPAAAELSQGKKSKRGDKEEDEIPVEFRIRKPTVHTKSGAPFQHQEMMDHAILTKDEEIDFGRKVVRARELREQVEGLLAERRAEAELRRLEMEELAVDSDDVGGEGDGGEGLDMDFLSYELEYLSVYGFRPSQSNIQEFDLEDDLLIDHAQHRSRHMSQLSNHDDIFTGNEKKGPKRNGYRNGSSAAGNANNRNSYTPLLHLPLNELSEADVVNVLEIPGGKEELVDILLEGSYAREVLMRRNVKLVMSIAKNWMRNSFSTAGANNLGSASGDGFQKKKDKKNSDKSTNRYLSQMYEGSWDRPSLDEAVQEGMLGLARAVDKYDPERGLRFSTYATHWITSYVRVCFQRAVTGCLRVPSQLHGIKAAYNRIVREHMQVNAVPPDQKNIASELGVSEKRLATAIRATGSLLSVDAPVMSAGSGSYKGSMAGGDGANGQELLILDTLKCDQPRPEDQVEISFLRQCLENAMASELTPYERDILRLRLGLDSGEGRTVRQIVEMSGGSVTTSDVRSTERRAFRKLRSPGSVHAHNLLAYLDMAGVDADELSR